MELKESNVILGIKYVNVTIINQDYSIFMQYCEMLFSLLFNFAIFLCRKFVPLHFNLAAYPVSDQITAVTLMVMGSSKSLHVFNLAILFKSRKSRKFDACNI